MGKRKVSILEPAAEAVADVALFIVSKGMPQTAKKFVDEAFDFLNSFPMKKYCINPVIIVTFGSTSIIVLLLIKNMLLLT